MNQLPLMNTVIIDMIDKSISNVSATAETRLFFNKGQNLGRGPQRGQREENPQMTFVLSVCFEVNIHFIFQIK